MQLIHKNNIWYWAFIGVLIFWMLSDFRACENRERHSATIRDINYGRVENNQGFRVLESKQQTSLSLSSKILTHLDSISKDTISRLRSQLALKKQENNILARRELLEARAREQMTWVLRSGQEDIVQSIRELKSQVDTLQQKNSRLQSLLSDSTRFSQKVKVQIEDSIVRQLQKELLGYTAKNQSLEQTLKQIQGQQRKPKKLKKIKRRKPKIHKKPNPDG